MSGGVEPGASVNVAQREEKSLCPRSEKWVGSQGPRGYGRGRAAVKDSVQRIQGLAEGLKSGGGGFEEGLVAPRVFVIYYPPPRDPAPFLLPPQLFFLLLLLFFLFQCFDSSYSLRRGGKEGGELRHGVVGGYMSAADVEREAEKE